MILFHGHKTPYTVVTGLMYETNDNGQVIIHIDPVGRGTLAV